ncbi:MAG: Cytochrome c, mono- and diheme variant [Hyphomicrobiales bacterium]|nr:Cytochrome c, mono- and diheme variant [Hyphomicrobiales bacterium]
MKLAARIFIAALVAAALGSAGFMAFANRHASLPPLDAGVRPSFPQELVERGEQLAGLGDCAVCHTRPGGPALAGGLPLPTPFGTIYSTNITPDRETGVGAWTEQAFQRAMREGVDRHGRHLYPAFPYDHFAKATSEDVRAIYAWLMTRTAVKAPAPQNDLAFPFNIRALVAGWNLLFLDKAPLKPDPAKSEAWNQGRYYVEGLGHCGACHSPRNMLGAVRSDRPLAGGEAEGWYAPGLGAHAGAPVSWTQEALLNYLIDGWDERHGVAGGPMTAVVNQLAKQPEDVVKAIAAYLVSLQPEQPKEAADRAMAFAKDREFKQTGAAAASTDKGEAIFARACANCHRAGGQTVPLALATSLGAPDARNLVQVVLHGVQPPEGAPERSMPRFAGALNDEQVGDLVAFMRTRFSEKPAWTNVPDVVKQTRAAH